MIKVRSAIFAVITAFAPIHGETPDSTVHPDFHLKELQMPSRYKTMGLAFLGDGTLVLAATEEIAEKIAMGEVPKPDPKNKVFLVKGISTDTLPVRIREVAHSWKQVTGVTVVEDRIFVADRDGFYEVLQKEPADEDFGANRKLIVNWPDEGKWDFGPYWHHWAFTPLFRDGHFYAPYSGSIRVGGSNTAPTSRFSGAMLKWDLSGNLEAFAGGLRAPNGAGLDPESGDMFVTDNQGSWLPASTFLRIREGRFYGHRQSSPDLNPDGSVSAVHPPNFAESLPYDSPIAWLPHGEVRSSPSQPVRIGKGWFAGDWLVGDVNNPGLVRVSLDKVGEEYNGGVFRFSGGMGMAAVNRMIAGPDTGIIIGTLCRIGGNWPIGEKTPMYKLTAKDNPSSFDFKAVRSVAGGLELEFTQPVHPDSLAPERFKIKTWEYIRDREYGKGKQAEETLRIASADASRDRKRLYLEIPGLLRDRVVHIKLAGLASSGGKPLWNDEAWFTLKALSGRAWNPDAGGARLAGPRPKAVGFKVFSPGPGVLEIAFAGQGRYTASLRNLAGALVDRRAGAGPARLRMGRPASGPGVYILQVAPELDAAAPGAAGNAIVTRKIIF